MEHNFERPTPWSVLRRAGWRECLSVAAIYAGAALCGIGAAIELGLIR